MARREGIATTGQLVKAIKSAVPSSYEGGRINPATRTFQALRIYVNQELVQLEKLMMVLPKIMASGGRVVVISFHSIEDRMVKQFFSGYTHGEKINKYADRSRGGSSVRGANLDAHAGELPNTSSAPSLSGKHPGDKRQAELLTKKPITASEAELEANPRSRSAKVRGIVFN
jgi:16S rRNA (cytosine1402-N4)-methyltransferase